jgi:hypothetical protein
MRDVHSNMSAAVLIANATYAADTTPASVDLLGFNAAEIILEIGAGGITFSGSNKVEFVLTHSDDDSSYSNVATADVLGAGTVTSGIIKSLIAAHAAGDVTRFGYIGGKRYLKLLADFSGTHGTGTPIAASR